MKADHTSSVIWIKLIEENLRGLGNSNEVLDILWRSQFTEVCMWDFKTILWCSSFLSYFTVQPVTFSYRAFKSCLFNYSKLKWHIVVLMCVHMYECTWRSHDTCGGTSSFYSFICSYGDYSIWLSLYIFKAKFSMIFAYDFV